MDSWTCINRSTRVDSKKSHNGAQVQKKKKKKEENLNLKTERKNNLKPTQ